MGVYESSAALRGALPIMFVIARGLLLRPLFVGLGYVEVGASVREGEVTADLYGFLTTTPNAEVVAVHSKARPVILTTAAEIEAWMTVPWNEAAALQRPLPNGRLQLWRGA